MASHRRLIANLATIGKIKASKKNPEALYLELGFEKKHSNNKFGGYWPLRSLTEAGIRLVIVDWLTPAYEAAMEGRADPYSGYTMDHTHLALALDLCYKELARRAEKLHK